MIKKTLMATAFATGLFLSANAQDYVSKKWGRPSKEKLTMTKCPIDSNANAVEEDGKQAFCIAYAI